YRPAAGRDCSGRRGRRHTRRAGRDRVAVHRNARCTSCESVTIQDVDGHRQSARTTMDLHPLIQLLIVILGPTGAAWAGVRAALNGTRRNVESLTTDVREMRNDLADLRERVAGLEAKIATRSRRRRESA